MAPLKTYSKRDTSKRNKGSIFTSIMNGNPISKKRGRKPKIQLKDLPPPSSIRQLSDSSLKVNKSDTFDKILDLTNCKLVTYKSKLRSHLSASTSVDDSSEFSMPFINVRNYVHSPILTRRRRLDLDTSNWELYSHTNCKSKSQKSTKQNSVIRTIKAKQNGISDESVNVSLEIEVVPKTKPMEYSSLNLDNNSAQHVTSTSVALFENFFSRTFTEKYGNNWKPGATIAKCSTPFTDLKMINDATMSPICDKSSSILEVALKDVSNADTRLSGTPRLRPRNSCRKSIFLANQVKDVSALLKPIEMSSSVASANNINLTYEEVNEIGMNLQEHILESDVVSKNNKNRRVLKENRAAVSPKLTRSRKKGKEGSGTSKELLEDGRNPLAENSLNAPRYPTRNRKSSKDKENLTKRKSSENSRNTTVDKSRPNKKRATVQNRNGSENQSAETVPYNLQGVRKRQESCYITLRKRRVPFSRSAEHRRLESPAIAISEAAAENSSDQKENAAKLYEETKLEHENLVYQDEEKSLSTIRGRSEKLSEVITKLEADYASIGKCDNTSSKRDRNEDSCSLETNSPSTVTPVIKHEDVAFELVSKQTAELRLQKTSAINAKNSFIEKIKNEITVYDASASLFGDSCYIVSNFTNTIAGTSIEDTQDAVSIASLDTDDKKLNVKDRNNEQQSNRKDRDDENPNVKHNKTAGLEDICSGNESSYAEVSRKSRAFQSRVSGTISPNRARNNMNLEESSIQSSCNQVSRAFQSPDSRRKSQGVTQESAILEGMQDEIDIFNLDKGDAYIKDKRIADLEHSCSTNESSYSEVWTKSKAQDSGTKSENRIRLTNETKLLDTSLEENPGVTRSKNEEKAIRRNEDVSSALNMSSSAAILLNDSEDTAFSGALERSSFSNSNVHQKNSGVTDLKNVDKVTHLCEDGSSGLNLSSNVEILLNNSEDTADSRELGRSSFSHTNVRMNSGVTHLKNVDKVTHLNGGEASDLNMSSNAEILLNKSEELEKSSFNDTNIRKTSGITHLINPDKVTHLNEYEVSDFNMSSNAEIPLNNSEGTADSRELEESYFNDANVPKISGITHLINVNKITNLNEDEASGFNMSSNAEIPLNNSEGTADRRELEECSFNVTNIRKTSGITHLINVNKVTHLNEDEASSFNMSSNAEIPLNNAEETADSRQLEESSLNDATVRKTSGITHLININKVTHLNEDEVSDFNMSSNAEIPLNNSEEKADSSELEESSFDNNNRKNSGSTHVKSVAKIAHLSEDEASGLNMSSNVEILPSHSEDPVDDFSTFAVPKVPAASLMLRPGKSYRRSLLQLRNTIHRLSVTSAWSDRNSVRSRIGSYALTPERSRCVAIKGGICACAICKQKSLEQSSPRRLSVRVVPVSPAASKDVSVLENYAVGMGKGYSSNAFQDNLLEEYLENLSLTRESLGVTLQEPNCISTVTARDIVLRRCGQTEPIPFEKCYPNTILQNCQKIGEGVYGEVFLFRKANGGGTSVMKIIPIEGNQIVNGERQKKFDEIISEIVIAMELSNLRKNKRNNTAGFNELNKISCVQGKYPERLLDLWELYNETHGSENDSPEMFEEDQLYIILELANGGKDLEAFLFNSAQQAYALFLQIACAVAVAESSLQFEHRDLHWGNILISNVDRGKKVKYCLDGKEIEQSTGGIEVSIIDFTLSRITHDGVCIFNDLSLDQDLFTAKGDYQFEIYRLMKESNGNQWQHFEPYTNVLWLHYILDKMVTAVRYKNKKAKIHKEYLKKLNILKTDILQYKSVTDIVNKKLTGAWET